MKYNLYSIVFIVLLSCNVSPDKESNNQLPEYKLVQYDSLSVDYLAGQFVVNDRSASGMYLGLDYLDKTLLLFDQFGNITHRFNRAGEDPWSFGNYLYAFGFYNDSTITVLTEKGIFFYNLQGDLKRKLPRKGDFNGFQTNSQLRILPFSHKNDSSLVTLTDFGTDYRLDKPIFYKMAKYITLINTNTNEWELYIKNKEPLYNSGKYFYPDRIIPIFDIDRQHKELQVKFPLGNTLFIYSLEDRMPLVDKVDLMPENMQEPEGVLFNNPEEYTGFSINGFYNHIHTHGDTTFLFYRTKFDIKKFSRETGLNFLKDPAGYYNEYRHVYTSTYCQIIVKDKKICKDIKLPQRTRYVAWVNSINSIIISEIPSNLETEEETINFYIYKLTPVLGE